MASHVEECLLCGLSYVVTDGSVDVGDDNLRLFKCRDSISCAERWLVKFLGGRPINVESIVMIGQDPNPPPTFEVGYRLRGNGTKKRRFTLQVHPESDLHRWTEHYHLMENGADLTSGFVP